MSASPDDTAHLTPLGVTVATARVAPARGRSRWWLIAALALVAMLLPTTAPAALADADREAAFVAAANRERADQGLAELATSSELTEVAREHSRRMAAADDLHHNPALGDDVGGWVKVGENVGRGGTVEAIHAALMDSPSHRRNILDGDWTQIGIGVVVDDGTVWVTQLFRKPAASTPSDEEGAADPDHATAATSSEEAAEAPRSTEEEPTAAAQRPLPLDRTLLTLARLSAAEDGTTVTTVLAELLGSPPRGD